MMTKTNRLSFLTFRPSSRLSKARLSACSTTLANYLTKQLLREPKTKPLILKVPQAERLRMVVTKLKLMRRTTSRRKLE
jgi:hypothetical protein